MPSRAEKPPSEPAEPTTRPGDLWLLGNHRLLCGDATKPDDVARVLDGAAADLLLTDPPYGVGYVGKTADALTIANDALEGDEYRRIWDLLTADRAWYNDYQAKTDRQIPLVRLPETRPA